MRRVKKLTSAATLEEHEERGRRFEFLGQRLLNVDVEGVWGKLEEDLTLGDGRANPDRILRALDEAEHNLRRAGMILQCAIEEEDIFNVHWRAAYSEWAVVAREALERAKKDGRHSGQITQDMVEDWVAAHIPDYGRWRTQRRSLERNKNMSKHLFAAWESRAASIRKQSDLVERRRGVDPNMLSRRERKEREDGTE